jgi:deazaflavin-dependent oxidoreductase (nitroreductase family)
MSEPAQPSRKPPPRWILKLFTRTHVFLNAATGGRAFNTLGGREVCFVTVTGAKSGRRLTIPLMYVPYRPGVLLVASQGGAPRNPVWYNNIVRHPRIEVRHRGRRTPLTARLATPDEKPALWLICDACYPPYADYRGRTSREIPIFVCEPGTA